MELLVRERVQLHSQGHWVSVMFEPTGGPIITSSGNSATRVAKIESPDNLLNAQLICHQQAMRFLAKTGGRSKWLPVRK